MSFSNLITQQYQLNPKRSRTCAKIKINKPQGSVSDQAPPFAKGRGWGGNVNMERSFYMHKKRRLESRLLLNV